jgi:hypothetical protein
MEALTQSLYLEAELLYSGILNKQKYKNLVQQGTDLEMNVWKGAKSLTDAHVTYFFNLLGDCAGTCFPSAPTCTLNGPSPPFVLASQYCRTLCGRVCHTAEICGGRPDLQQQLNDECYTTCTCKTQGLSLGGASCFNILDPTDGLTFCYANPGCPSDGHYWSQAAVDFSTATDGGRCPLDAPNGITGY